MRRGWVVAASLAALAALIALGMGGQWNSRADPTWGTEAERWLANVRTAGAEGVPNVAEFLRGDIVLDDRATGGWVAEGTGASLGLIRHLAVAHPDLTLHPLYLGRRGMVVPISARGTGPAGAYDAVAVLQMSPDGLVHAETAPSLLSAYPGDAAGWTAGRRRWLELFAAAWAERHDAVLDRVPDGWGAAAYGVPVTGPVGGFRRVVLLLRPAHVGGCPVGRAVSLSLDPAGEVLEVERFVLLEEARRCLGPEERFDGWWTGMEVPDPVRHERTGTVTAAGVSVEVWNGTPPLDDLAAWSLRRYADAGLPVPRPTSLTFYPAADRCLGNLAVAGGEENREIVLCFGEALACRGLPCPPWTHLAEITMLHELAHTWMTQNLPERRRAAYADLVGLRWATYDDPWELRAIERAAAVIAWGLDPPAGTPGHEDLPESDLEREFRFLTGVSPLRANRLTP